MSARVRYACFGNGTDTWEVCKLTSHTLIGSVENETLKVFTVEQMQRLYQQQRKTADPKKYKDREPRLISKSEAYELAREKAIEMVAKLKAEHEPKNGK
jgi:hypothetical protein